MASLPHHPTTVLLGVTGSIAAYKAAELTRLLRKRGLAVEVIVTRSALRFVGADTFAGLTGGAVHQHLFGQAPGELHVELAKRADLLVIAPATADAIARLAQGRADDLLGATALCFDGPTFVAPAMHPTMWQHPATRANVELLERRGVLLLGPAHGEVASGDQGLGRLWEPSEIVEQLLSSTSDLRGRRLVVSAGPTLEDLDPVRFIGNRSSGKMGFAIAERAARRGARVCLVTGPVALRTPPGVERHDVRSAEQMSTALERELERGADALIMAAAVGDFRAREPSSSKLVRSAGVQLDLVGNPDVIATLAGRTWTPRPTFVAFAVETGNDEEIQERAHQKLQRKHVDLVVANRADEAFGLDHNRAHFITEHQRESLPTMSKHALANALLDRLNRLWGVNP